MVIDSFRDPAGTLSIKDGQVLRTVFPEYLPVVNFAKSLQPLFPSWLISSRSVTTTLISHPKIFFPTYPREWSATQLWQAASRTLDILEVSLERGFTLKDASAYNLLFEYTNPLFIDILSFTPLKESSPFWLAYGQFCHHFIYPLIAYRETGINIATLFTFFHDGLTSSDLKKHLSARSFVKQSILKEIYLMPLLGKIEKKLKINIETPTRYLDAQQLQKKVVGSLRKKLVQLKPQVNSSFWNNYSAQRSHYSPQALAEKRKAVENFLDYYKPTSLLDLGCNRGEYAIIAAKRGASTVAVDSDATCIDHLYQAASAYNLPLLPLIQNLAYPTPQSGFCFAEKSSFQERVAGSFQAIFCLSLLHHLVLTERIPLRLVFEFLKATKTPLVLLEWIGPGDKKAQNLSTYNKDRLNQLERPFFEQTALSYCKIVSRIDLSSIERSLYVLRFEF